MNETGFSKLKKSRRAWVALATLLATILSELSGVELDPAAIVALGAVLVGGYAIEDAARARDGHNE